jgi:hypothetical protein
MEPILLTSTIGPVEPHSIISARAVFGHPFDAIKDPNNEPNRTYRGIFASGCVRQMMGILGFLLPQRLVRRLP